MGLHDGFTQRQAQSQTPAPVGDLIPAGIKHLEDVLLHFIGDARTVVADCYHGVRAILPGLDADLRADLRVLDRVGI